MFIKIVKWSLVGVFITVASVSLFLYYQSKGCSEDNLINAVYEYYAAESKKDWSAAYNMRDEGFKERVPFRQYEENMNKDSLGWELKEIKILKTTIIANRARVTLNIKELLPPEHPLRERNITFLDLDGKSMWVCKDSKWYAFDALTRGHLFYNAP